jgi:predicted transcriptional regulator
MSRILIDLPDDDIRALDAMAQANGRSRAAEMREAVALYLRRQADGNWITQGAGYWADRPGKNSESGSRG